MSLRAAGYERELKEILQANPEATARYRRSLDPVDRARVDRACERPFLVIRAAGSFGFDLVALRAEFALPFEVKASRSDTIRFSAASGRASQQLDAHRAAVGRVGLVVAYAFRRLGHRSGDPWRVFLAATPANGGILGVLARRLPPLSVTRDGNAVLRWDEGMPLSEFLHTVAALTDRSGDPS